MCVSRNPDGLELGVTAHRRRISRCSSPVAPTGWGRVRRSHPAFADTAVAGSFICKRPASGARSGPLRLSATRRLMSSSVSVGFVCPSRYFSLLEPLSYALLLAGHRPRGHVGDTAPPFEVRYTGHTRPCPPCEHRRRLHLGGFCCPGRAPAPLCTIVRESLYMSVAPLHARSLPALAHEKSD